MGILISYLTIIPTLNGLLYPEAILASERERGRGWVKETGASAVARAIFLGEQKDNCVTSSYEL